MFGQRSIKITTPHTTATATLKLLYLLTCFGHNIFSVHECVCVRQWKTEKHHVPKSHNFYYICFLSVCFCYFFFFLSVYLPLMLITLPESVDVDTEKKDRANCEEVVFELWWLASFVLKLMNKCHSMAFRTLINVLDHNNVTVCSYFVCICSNIVILQLK